MTALLAAGLTAIAEPHRLPAGVTCSACGTVWRGRNWRCSDHRPTVDAGVLELVATEDLSIDQVGSGLCEELLIVRDELLDLIVESGRRLDAGHDRLTEAGVLVGLIRSLGRVLDVDEADARREALRKIAADRMRRAV